MASVYELRGTSFNSFFVGKKGPTISKTNVRDISIRAVSSTTLGGGSVNLIAASGATTGGSINLTAGTHTGAGAIGGIAILPSGTGVGETTDLRFTELAANGTNYVGLKAPDAVAANQIWTLPVADGGDGDVLTTNGVGVTSWSSPSVFEAYSGVAQILNATAKVINISTARFVNADFTIGGTGVVTVNRAGLYAITYTVSADSSNNSRTGGFHQLFVNGGAYASSAAYSYHRTVAVGENTAGRTVLAQLAVGDTVEIRSTRIAGTGLTTIANESSILFERKGP